MMESQDQDGDDVSIAECDVNAVLLQKENKWLKVRRRTVMKILFSRKCEDPFLNITSLRGKNKPIIRLFHIVFLLLQMQMARLRKDLKQKYQVTEELLALTKEQRAKLDAVS